MSVINAILSFGLALFTVAGNSIVLVVFWHNPFRCLRGPSEILILALTLLDLLTGILVDSLYGTYYLIYGRGDKIPVLAKAGDILSYFTLNAAILVVVGLSMDRWMAVCVPFTYKTFITRKKLRRFVVAVFTYSLLFALVPCLPGVDMDSYRLVDIHLHTTIPLLFLTAAYIHIYVSFSKQHSKVKLHNVVSRFSGLSPEERAMLEKERHFQKQKDLLKTVFIVLLLSYICALPYFICVHLMHYCSSCDATSLARAQEISDLVLYLNSAVNPWVYCGRMTKFRRSVSWLLGRKSGDRTKTEEMK